MLPEADAESLRLVTCHLGNGCSLAAVFGGRCVDTTMGFTPLEGLMMGSRSGSVDPGVLLYLLGQPGVTPENLGRILNEESGLRGLSGVSEDVRAVTTAIDTGSARARLALDVYIHRLRWHIGAMTASLGGLDVLVFTAGVGENSPAIRSAVCEPFAFLGLFLDQEKNRSLQGSLPGGSVDISRPNSRVRVLVIPANEDWAVARDCWRLAGAVHNPV
jgi:acetate kinase